MEGWCGAVYVSYFNFNSHQIHHHEGSWGAFAETCRSFENTFPICFVTAGHYSIATITVIPIIIIVVIKLPELYLFPFGSNQPSPPLTGCFALCHLSWCWWYYRFPSGDSSPIGHSKWT